MFQKPQNLLGQEVNRRLPRSAELATSTPIREIRKPDLNRHQKKKNTDIDREPPSRGEAEQDAQVRR